MDYYREVMTDDPFRQASGRTQTTAPLTVARETYSVYASVPGNFASSLTVSRCHRRRMTRSAKLTKF
jgi:hypothetical protein